MRRLVILFFLIGHCALAQNDAAKIYEAQYAMENAKDCKAAKKALSEVSAEGQKQQGYVYNMAKACECLNDYSAAVDNYNKYLQFVPGDTATLKKIGRLSYELRKENNRKNLTGKWISVVDGKEVEFTIEHKGSEIEIEEVNNRDSYFTGTYENSYKVTGKKYGIGWKVKTAKFFNDSCKVCMNSQTSAAYCDIAEDGNKISVYNHSFYLKPNMGKEGIPKECCIVEEDDVYAISWTLTRK